ncbi:abo [Symbiodinium microadriaticum]|nr:abo [Symbiodinium microadriaticum]
MEGDVTVCKLAWDKFLVIATDTMHRHVGNWLDRNLDPSGVKHVLSSDVTGGYAQLNVQGPLSRELLKSITDTDMSDAAFPFRAAKGIFVGYAPLVCARITYVGELGYELHIPCEFAQHVYDRVVEAGKQFDLTHCGLKALGSLRLEKAYRDYGHDMDNMDSLMEVGLGFTADMNKADGFLGDHKVRSQKADLKAAKGLRRRLVQVLVQDKDAMMYHGEVLWRNDEIVGDVRIGSYGHTLGGPVGLAMVELGGSEVVNKSFLESGKWEVEISNRRFPVRVSLAPMYDPQNTRIKS